jgi:hypothetical protein
MLTKGAMVNTLKKNGIRTGDKNGAKVKLEHMKTPDLAKLYFTYCK